MSNRLLVTLWRLPKYCALLLSGQRIVLGSKLSSQPGDMCVQAYIAS